MELEIDGQDTLPLIETMYGKEFINQHQLLTAITDGVVSPTAADEHVVSSRQRIFMQNDAMGNEVILQKFQNMPI